MIDLSDVKVGDTLYDAGIRSDHRQNRNPNPFMYKKLRVSTCMHLFDRKMGLIAVPILKSSAITGGLRVGWRLSTISQRRRI
ncbi:hypothetical protein ALHIDCOG_00244 [Klebsiella phage CPRSB]|nr:hypothetical protein ALHIDCOG_00244 [Klebsiella phage CPRSB]